MTETRGHIVMKRGTKEIYWNGVSTFNVYVAGRNVNAFTVEDVKDINEAVKHAEQWWDEYGRQSTGDLIREEKMYPARPKKRQ